jgi:hypothetical protein
MATLLIRRRRPIGEPPTLRSLDSAKSPAPAAELDGTVGAGRICQVLAELGVELAAVRQLVIDPHAPLGTLDAIDLEAAFETVALGSHLVNVPNQERRTTFLRLARRHVATGGSLFIEHHPLDWAESAEPTRPTPGAEVGMVDVRRDPPFVSAVSVFDIGGRVVRQPFTARVLSDADLDAALRAAGLVRHGRRSPTLLEAVPVS